MLMQVLFFDFLWRLAGIARITHLNATHNATCAGITQLALGMSH